MSKELWPKYYQDNKERLQKKEACEQNIKLSEEKRNKKRQYCQEQYRNLPEDEKQRLVEV